MLKRVKATNIESQFMELYQKAYEDALYRENLVLTRSERNRLFKQTMKSVFDEILKKYDKPPTDTQRE